MLPGNTGTILAVLNLKKRIESGWERARLVTFFDRENLKKRIESTRLNTVSRTSPIVVESQEED